MFSFITGDMLESNAECLINTVNCEGYMGKGIAYQFKLKFPENNDDYVKACKSRTLRIGTIHHYQEKGKLIINFPTKDKWREKSKIEYINIGLAELVKLIPTLNIKSIAVPPLGCGNGGLMWADVKTLIVEQLKSFSKDLDIIIYEPSKYYKSKATVVPKINASHLILMTFKLKLNKFSKIRLQKTAYFMNLFSGTKYFDFTKYKLGPYAHSIDILTKSIKEFQDHYKIDTEKAYDLAKTMVISKSTENKLKTFDKAIEEATNFVNQISSAKELELLATICFILESKQDLTAQEIVREVKEWSDEKASKFSEKEILKGIPLLLDKKLIQENLMGQYNISNIN